MARVRNRWIVAVAGGITAALIAAFAFTGSGTANPPPPSIGLTGRTLAEVDALQRSEQLYFFQNHRHYTGRLGDLFEQGYGADIAINLTMPLDVHLDVSSSRKSVLIRVTGPTVSLMRALQRGNEVGRGCQVIADAGGCPER